MLGSLPLVDRRVPLYSLSAVALYINGQQVSHEYCYTTGGVLQGKLHLAWCLRRGSVKFWRGVMRKGWLVLNLFVCRRLCGCCTFQSAVVVCTAVPVVGVLPRMNGRCSCLLPPAHTPTTCSQALQLHTAKHLKAIACQQLIKVGVLTTIESQDSISPCRCSCKG